MKKNPIIWWELATFDAEKSVKFFEEVFEWEFERDERFPNLFDTKIDKETPKMGGGGIFNLRKAKLPFVALYISVEDIEGMARKVEEHGGYIIEHPNEVAKNTWICLFNDPSGVTFAMHERKK